MQSVKCLATDAYLTADPGVVSSAGLPQSGKKFWKMKNVPGQGKIREFHFQSGKFRKNEKNHGKVREIKKFQKNC